ncbi:MAG TPA: hypothetical protein PLI13_07625 [Paracoccus sp. (in: a-proteobacteria)]|nr:hypothetical protein [Paracoccus sp. (in: a-proteobacteria)]
MNTIGALDRLGRVRLSQNFWMREFLYSEVANLHGLTNFPDDPDLAIAAGTRLCNAGAAAQKFWQGADTVRLSLLPCERFLQ